MIETKELTKNFGPHKAVDNVTFKIQQGECVGLLGLNGAGKTTLLRMLTCLLTPTSGSAFINGLDIAGASLDVRRLIGFLPEVPPLYGEMPVGQFLSFVARLRGVDGADVPSWVHNAIDRCQLSDVSGQIIDTLSYGYKKRVGIAQAIVHRPPIVVLDEPIAGLDPAQIVEMREMIRRLSGEHTILLSSHILGEISQTCDRIMVMHKGKIAAQGTEEQLLGGLTRTQRLCVTVRGEQDKVESVFNSIDSVSVLNCSTSQDGSVVTDIQSSGDVRSKVARALVESGLELLELRQLKHDLEAVFLELTVKSEEES